MKILTKAILLTSMVFIAACQPSGSDVKEKKEIKVGFGPSTYVDQFEGGIKPILEKQGYVIKTVVLSQNTQIDPALKEGAIDATVHQSIAYMQDMNNQYQMNMIKLADTPSAPQSLRSIKHHSLDDIKDGMTVLVPNDPVNMERAVRILEDLGWVTIKPNINVFNFSLNDVLPNQYQLNIKELDPAQTLRALQDVDFAVVNGNYVANAGEKISDGLVVEKTPDQHVVMVTIKEEDKDTEWAKDLKKAYESQAFKDYILAEDKYSGFIMPKIWSSLN